uniref:Uncharacterized protein n=1 Tax=Nelumbo nucifera TaxID=4432 RepID=A0A822YVW2_NELNU|nr:TPA_asm: hypothetical protein HUJ06_007463 [Nelumbo nucifera]
MECSFLSNSLLSALFCEYEVENLRPDNKATPLDAFRFTESSSPACITAKMKGLMKGLRYFSQIFGIKAVLVKSFSVSELLISHYGVKLEQN